MHTHVRTHTHTNTATWNKRHCQEKKAWTQRCGAEQREWIEEGTLRTSGSPSMGMCFWILRGTDIHIQILFTLYSPTSVVVIVTYINHTKFK